MAHPRKATMLTAVVAGAALALAATPVQATPTDGGGAGDNAAARSPQRVAAYKAAHDTDPHLALSPSARRGIATRTEAAKHTMRTTRAEAAAGPAAASRTLAGTQKPQQTSYWCGPAAVSSALAVRDVSASQKKTANWLRTTRNGTDWSGTNANIPAKYQHGYPVADVLTYKLHSQGATYYPIGLAYAPTAKQKSTFRTRLVADINNGWDLVGDAWEVPGGPHLVGHPGNQEIFHYYTIRGYTHSGANTRYSDPVHGASSISWASGVPAYSTMSSNTVTTINGGRGYVW